MEKIKQVSPAINGRPIKNEDLDLFLAGITNLAEMVKGLIGTEYAVPLSGANITSLSEDSYQVSEGVIYQDGKFIYVPANSSFHANYSRPYYKLASENSRVYKDGIARDSIVFYEATTEAISGQAIRFDAFSTQTRLANTLSNASLNGRLAKYSEITNLAPYSAFGELVYAFFGYLQNGDIGEYKKIDKYNNGISSRAENYGDKIAVYCNFDNLSSDWVLITFTVAQGNVIKQTITEIYDARYSKNERIISDIDFVANATYTTTVLIQTLE